MKMIVEVPEWTFECFGPKSRTKGNPVLKKGQIIEVSNDWARKLASRGVAAVYRGKEAGVEFPPAVASAGSSKSAALQEVEAEIKKQEAERDAQKADSSNAGAAKGPVNGGKG